MPPANWLGGLEALGFLLKTALRLNSPLSKQAQNPASPPSRAPTPMGPGTRAAGGPPHPHPLPRPPGAPRLGATKNWKREEEGAREASGGELTQGPEPTLRSESSLTSDRRGLESAAP